MIRRENIFAQNLKARRVELNLSRKQVAEKLNITFYRYLDMEHGFVPNCDLLIKICKLYEIDANYLFGISKKIVYPIIKEN